MIETTKLFDDDAMRRLRSFLGSTLDAYEGYIAFENPDQAYKQIRLDFGGQGFDLVNEHQLLPLGPASDEEEVAVMNMLPGFDRDIWCPRNKQILRKEGIGLHVDDIYLIVDTANLTKGSIPVNKLKLVQAVVFRDGFRLLAFDRDIWFDEFINVREGADIDVIVRDCEGDWSEDLPFGYTFTRDIISIAQGGIRV